MSEVGLSDAKTHLSSLLRSVERGEEVTITRHGVPVARIVPANASPKDPKKAAEKIRELRKGLKLGDVTLRQLIEEGRRY